MTCWTRCLRLNLTWVQAACLSTPSSSSSDTTPLSTLLSSVRLSLPTRLQVQTRNAIGYTSTVVAPVWSAIAFLAVCASGATSNFCCSFLQTTSLTIT